MYNILVVDDDKEIVKAIEIYLEKENYFIYKAYDGEEALKQINDNVINLIIMDIMMPKKDGIETLEEIRKNKDIPVILLSAKSEDIDKINGLNIGADDYITKPFSLIVLISKVNAFMRRIGNTIIENIIFCDKLKFDYVENKLTKDKEEILLSKNEGKLLKYLMENSSQTVTKEKLMEALWDIDGNFVDENTVAVNIRRLRQKVEDNPSEPEYIKNIRGVGYTFAKRCIKK